MQIEFCQINIFCTAKYRDVGVNPKDSQQEKQCGLKSSTSILLIRMRHFIGLTVLNALASFPTVLVEEADACNYHGELA